MYKYDMRIKVYIIEQLSTSTAGSRFDGNENCVVANREMTNSQSLRATHHGQLFVRILVFPLMQQSPIW